MRILRYLSDLHLERVTDLYSAFNLRPFLTTDPTHRYFLALVGDIANVTTPAHRNKLTVFLKQLSPVYEQIYYVLGNHEYYGLPLASTRAHVQAICLMFPNVTLLDNDVAFIDELKIIGTTLWSEVTDQRLVVESSINDYRSIYHDETRKLTVDDTNRFHQEAVTFLKRELETTQPVVVLTHHAPLFNDPDSNHYTCDPKYTVSPHGQAYCTDLRDLLQPPIKYWLFGHTHFCTSFEVQGVKVVSNQGGYRGENLPFGCPELEL